MYYTLLVFLLLILTLGQSEIFSEASVMKEFSKEQLFLLERRGLSKPYRLSNVPVTRFLPSQAEKLDLQEKQVLVFASPILHNASSTAWVEKRYSDEHATEVERMPSVDEHVIQEFTIIETMPSNHEWLLSNKLDLTELVYDLNCEIRGENETIICQRKRPYTKPQDDD